MNVLATGEGESLEDLAANTSCPNHQNLGALQTNKRKFNSIYKIEYRGFLGVSTFFMAGERFREAMVIGEGFCERERDYFVLELCLK